MSEQPKTVVDQVMSRFRDFAKDIFTNFGEPQNLCLVVDWNIGQTDFPAGMLVPRNKQITPEELLEIRAQLVKFEQRLITFFDDGVRETTMELIRLKQEVAQLEQAKQRLSEELNGPEGTTGVVGFN